MLEMVHTLLCECECEYECVLVLIQSLRRCKAVKMHLVKIVILCALYS